MIGWLIRLICGSRFTVTALLIPLTFGTAAWQFQAMRYSGKLAHAEAALATYQAQVATAQAQLTEAQAKVVTKVEVQYRDRIKVVKEKGETIIREVPVYVTEQDASRFGVNVGFVRVYNAAFTGESAGSATEFDREPASLSLTELGEVSAFNAGVCRQWREQALGWRIFYRRLQEMEDQY